MPKTLPSIIEAYFGASNAHDTVAMLRCFALDAVVRDEGQEYRGTAAVSRWIEATTKKYQTTIAVTDTKEQAGECVITGQVSGSFDGSPIEIQFHFTSGGRQDRHTDDPGMSA